MDKISQATFNTGMTLVNGVPHVGIEIVNPFGKDKVIIMMEPGQARCLSDSILKVLSEILEKVDHKNLSQQ